MSRCYQLLCLLYFVTAFASQNRAAWFSKADVGSECPVGTSMVVSSQECESAADSLGILFGSWGASSGCCFYRIPDVDMYVTEPSNCNSEKNRADRQLICKTDTSALWEFYGNGRCERDQLPILAPPSGFQFDGTYAPEGSMYYFERTSLEMCGELCLSNEWCAFFSWKADAMTAQGTAWCYISADCDNLVDSDDNGFDNHSYKYDTYAIREFEEIEWQQGNCRGSEVWEITGTIWDCVHHRFGAQTTAECAQRCLDEPKCDSFDSSVNPNDGTTAGTCCLFKAGASGNGNGDRFCYYPKIDVVNVDTTIWSNMKGFDSVCSTSEYSIEIRIDQTLYAQLDEDFVNEDCKTLCESVGSVCLDGWGDLQNNRCPVGDETTNHFGCSSNIHDTFVCSCAVITSPSVSTYVRGERGVDACPSGYVAIREEDACSDAAFALGLIYDATKNDAHADSDTVCNWCGGCRPRTVRLDRDHGSSAEWICQKENASKVINYDDCITEISVTGPPRPEHGWNHGWNTQCPENTAIVSVETGVVEKVNAQLWTIMKMQCCGLVDKITDFQNYDRIPETGLLQGGGSSSVEDQWDAQCGSNAIMVGIWNDDDSGDFDDIDATKCSALDCPYTCGEKMDNDDCVVVNLSPNSKSSCPIDYVLVGLYDDETTSFGRVRKMKCCRVLESILPTVSPTKMPTTNDPSECPTVSPTTNIPSMSPTTDDPTLYPSRNPTTDKPTNVPSFEPTKFPTRNPTTDDPTALPSITPTVVPTISPSTDQPTKFPTRNPTTDDPTAFPSITPTVVPTISPSTDHPTKFPTRNPTTDDPTAFPSNAPTVAPTICEPTCRSHTDQMMNILGRLLEIVLQTSNGRPLRNELNEMILDFNRLKDQMQKHDNMPLIQ